MRGEVLRGHLDLLLLSAVQAGPAHGYAIVERLRDRSSGVLEVAEGTIYPALHRLEGAGLLSSRWSTVAGRRRRVYRLTARGERGLVSQSREWRAFVAGVDAVVGAT
ncbi:MAG: helix-turn-helix transcriptional regulator [Actinomycetota bacterium]|nr:helix-turn-helix transcriptional regulator [Actinomycetota bacterium]